MRNSVSLELFGTICSGEYKSRNLMLVFLEKKKKKHLYFLHTNVGYSRDSSLKNLNYVIISPPSCCFKPVASVDHNIFMIYII